MFDLFCKGLIGFLVLFLIVFIILVGFGIKASSDQADKCRSAGGVPDFDRGVYKACMKPHNFIKIN